MLALAAAACALLIQGPEQPEWARDGVDPSRPMAVVVKGTVELTPQEALEAARLRADALVERTLRSRATEVAEQVVPRWIPDFATAGIVERWAGGLARSADENLLERHDHVRDHQFGKSFQTWLLVEPGGPPSARAVRTLEHRLGKAVRLFWLKCGATGLFWGGLTVVLWWLDRLSRGYMTGRLAALAGLAGVVVPAAAFVFIR